jgi:hypothetical protein
MSENQVSDKIIHIGINHHHITSITQISLPPLELPTTKPPTTKPKLDIANNIYVWFFAL